MRTALTLIILFCLSTCLHGQQYSCNGKLLRYKVSKENGIKLLSQAKDNADSITTLIKGTSLTVCEGTHNFKWVKAFYKDTIGYVDKRFIKIQQPINVAILNRWMGDGFPIAQEYYGIFDKKNQYGRNESTIEKCETKIDSVKANDGVYYPLTKLLQENKPRIMISGLDIEVGSQNKGQFFDSKFLYPGEAIHWSYGGNQYLIYAKGEIEENTDTTSINAFSGIRNYEFYVKRQMNGVTEVKILYKTDFHSWNAFQYEGGVNLHWIGDIDGDKQLDIILTVSNHYACWEVSFFLSSQAESDNFFKEVTKYQACGC